MVVIRSLGHKAEQVLSAELALLSHQHTQSLVVDWPNCRLYCVNSAWLSAVL